MDEPKESKNAMRYASLTTQLMVTMLIAVWAGYKIDEWLKWRFPLFLILFALISLLLSLWQIIQEFNKPKK